MYLHCPLLDSIRPPLAGLLRRFRDLQRSFGTGTPFTEEATANWIHAQRPWHTPLFGGTELAAELRRAAFAFSVQAQKLHVAALRAPPRPVARL